RCALETRPLLELVQDPKHLDATPARRYRTFDPGCVEGRSDAIAMSRQQARQHGGEVDEQITLAAVDGAEVDRWREIQKEMSVDLAVLDVLPHVVRVEPRGQRPVDLPDDIPEYVLADVSAVESPTLADRAVVAVKQTDQASDHGQVEALERALRRGGRHVPAAARSVRECARARASR